MLMIFPDDTRSSPSQRQLALSFAGRRHMGERDADGHDAMEATVMRPQVRDFVRAFGVVADEPQAAGHNTAALDHSLRSLGRGTRCMCRRRRSTSLAVSRATGWST